ncbi:MAG: hypothetical protein IJI68_01880 [Eggerthellaceae bacterium]|nr:hypothetical protein [Eggerthellaceae bacterium]
MALSATEALERLKAGNAAYVEAQANTGDISQERVKELSENGQAPYACIVSCADSRVVPEHIFMAGLGELFCIRVAGNVIGDMELASCVYAAEHLGVKLIVVLGHTQCGAVASALEVLAAGDTPEGAMAPVLAGVCAGVGEEREPVAASQANMRTAVDTVLADPEIAHLVAGEGLVVSGALYRTETGAVDF